MKLSWDEVGTHEYEVGVDRGVFYPQTGPGVPWNGLLKVNEEAQGTGQLAIYIDGQRRTNQLDLGTFGGSIEAFTYPDEFLPYDGYSEPMFSGQKRPEFDLTYRTLLADDISGTDRGYRLHLVYNCMVTPSNRTNGTLNASVDISTFNWKLSTRPEALPYDRPTAHLYLESPNVEGAALSAIENILYGTSTTNPRMPTIAEIIAIFEANAIFIVINHGDGTATVTGPDDWVFPDAIDPTLWTLASPSIFPLGDHQYKVSSY
jgi:hypothetical protein